MFVHAIMPPRYVASASGYRFCHILPETVIWHDYQMTDSPKEKVGVPIGDEGASLAPPDAADVAE